MKLVQAFDNLLRSRALLLVVGIVVAIFLASHAAVAQSQAGFLYGKVYTKASTYEGQLRWGTEEAFWTDYFNAAKKSADSYKKLVAQQNKENDSWTNFDWDILSIWADRTTLHQFSCQFGDMKQLQVTGRSTARIQFKNGLQIEVNGEGYNDIGGKVQVLDKELGWTAIEWEKIDKIEFAAAPKVNTAGFGEPIFGTVETDRKEKFTGSIHWDKDERLSMDKLDGDSRDGKIAVSFSEIAMIEKRGNGCDVRLKSGRSIYLTGSNDVDDDNRGITIITGGIGMINVPWESFKRLTFTAMEDSGPSYDSFVTPRQLSGKVTTYDDRAVSGQMIFDIDEMLDVETLEGKDNGLEYTIPFRNIKSIKPKNEDFSLVELKNGETLLLGDGRDVSEGNDGILVFEKGKKEPVHVRWKRVEQITFD